MVTSVETSWNRFRRVALEPFWAPNPAAWHVDGIGIAHYAMDGKVGLFNLSWWLLGLSQLPTKNVYREAVRLQWPLLRAPSLTVNNLPLIDLAAVITQNQWNRFVLGLDNHRMLNAAQIEGYTVTLDKMRHRALVGEWPSY